MTQLFCYLSKNLDIEACCYILVLFTLINKTEQKIICIIIVLALLGIYQSKKDLMKIFDIDMDFTKIQPECDKEFSQK